MFKKLFAKKNLNIIRICVLAAVVVSIIMLNINALRHIAAKDIEQYRIVHYSESTCEMQQGEIETSFKAVSKRILFLELQCLNSGSIMGTIDYDIIDKNGICVLHGQKRKIEDILDTENQILRLDTADAVFDPGMQYALKICLDLESPIELMVDTEGCVHTQVYKVNYQWYLRLMMIIIDVAIGLFFVIYWKWGWTDKLFLFMVLTVGFLLVVLVTPFSREDEIRHFARAYDLSYGGEMGYYDVPAPDSVGNVMAEETGKAYLIKIPREIAELQQVSYTDNYANISYLSEINLNFCPAKVMSIFNQPEEEGLIEVSEVATVWRGWESYWPQIFMIWLARILGLRSGLWYYMARLGQVIVSSFFLWCAMRLMKNHKNLVWFCSFIAPVMLLRSSCNPDGLMMAEIILSISVVIYLRENKYSLIEKKSLALLALYFVLIFQIYRMKIPYVIFCLGFLLMLKKENFAFMPKGFFQKHKYKLCIVTVIICAVLIGYFGVMRSGDILLDAIYKFVPQDHVEYILANKRTVGSLFLHKAWWLILETKTAMRGDYYISYNRIFLVAMLFNCKRMSIADKCYQIFLFVAVVVMIVLVGYTLTPPDYGMILGITWRYILPAAPAIGFVLPFGTEKTEYYAEQFYPIFFIAVAASSCLSWIHV